MDCREYLQVTALVDITPVDGKEIMLQAWQGRLYKQKVFYCSWSRQPPRKHLDWDVWRQTLVPILYEIKNRPLTYPFSRWDKEAIYHWKWIYSLTTNPLYARYGQVYMS